MQKRSQSVWLYAAFAAFAAFAPGIVWANAAAGGLRAAEHPDGITRVVIDLSQSINFTTRLAENPYRIIVDTETLTWAVHPSLPRTTGPILGIAYGEDNPGAHLTLKLARPADVKSAFLMSPRDGTGWRFVIDVKDVSKQEFAAQAHPDAAAHLTEALPPTPKAKQASPETVQTVDASSSQPALALPAPIVVTSPAFSEQQPVSPPRDAPTPAAKGTPMLTAPLPPSPAIPSSAQQDDAAIKTAMVSPAAPAPVLPPDDKPRAVKQPKQESDARQVVVIDPGHGGVDPGAIGISGIYEKYVTYSMAQELQRQLEKTGHYRVHLTRDRDVFIPLRERTAIARQLNADLFISLHADVVKDPDIRGLSVYTLSQNASDAEAQTLADKENKADLIAGIDLSHETTDVTNILIDLAQRETMNRSAGFAGEIVEELGRDTPLLSNTHRFAGFAVLKSPDVPAVLIEMGYLSNPVDEKNLRQPEYRAKLAHAISRAVERYFLQGQKARRP